MGGIRVLDNAKVYVDAWDLSGAMNSLGLDYGAEAKENTTFGIGGVRSNLGGLKRIKASHQGMWSGGADLADEVLYGRLALQDVPMTMAPETGAEGEVGYSFLTLQTKYAMQGDVGEMMKFTVEADSDGSSPLVRGTFLVNATKVASGNGTAFQSGAVAANQSVYGALHLLSLTGTSLQVLIQSATSGGFGTPHTQITFPTLTVKGSAWASLAGVNADTWWRVSWTLVGSSATFLVLSGIQ